MIEQQGNSRRIMPSKRNIVLVAVVVSMVAVLVHAAKTALYSERYSKLCQGAPVIARKHEKALTWLFKNVAESSLVSVSAPQHDAACWMLRQKQSSFSPQRFAVATIYYATKGPKWDINTDWMSTKHECNWYGVKCNMWKSIVELDLGYIKVDGLIPREIGLLKDLKDLDLHGNDLQGVIPHKLLVGSKGIEYLRLHMNGLFGAIHKEIINMKGLKELYLFGNYIAGTIPKELTQLKKLEVIDIYANQLEGTIPSELAKLPNLKYLDVHDNNLVGTMPKEICDKKLNVLIADCLGRNPEVRCDCCTHCCAGLPVMACVDKKTGKEVDKPVYY
mmetsp:Transcript_24089/g.56961  ORF Transcript_24089/g.56961 Transcript_24089/m.56961 type:complete len:332 (+) Transcript_24089:93-1088(+)